MEDGRVLVGVKQVVGEIRVVVIILEAQGEVLVPERALEMDQCHGLGIVSAAEEEATNNRSFQS